VENNQQVDMQSEGSPSQGEEQEQEEFQQQYNSQCLLSFRV